MRILVISWLMLVALVALSCEKVLSISEFEDGWAGYEPELRIEAMIYPMEKNVVIRIDRSMNIAEEAPFLDVDLNDDGENDIDIDSFHVTDCNVILYHPNSTDTLFLHYQPDGAQYYLYGTPDSISPVIDYGAYVPDTINHVVPDEFFTYGTDYQVQVYCADFDELGTIMASQPVQAPYPPVFLDGESIPECLETAVDTTVCFTVRGPMDTLYFDVEYNDDETTYFSFGVPYDINNFGSINYYVSRYKFIEFENPDEGEYIYRFPGYMYEYSHEIYPLEDVYIPYLHYSEEKIYVVENESAIYKYVLQAFSYEYSAYIQFTANGLPLFDPVVSNLRDETGAVVMGVLGVSSNSTVNARINIIEPETSN